MKNLTGNYYEIQFMDSNKEQFDGFKTIWAKSEKEAEEKFNELYPDCFIFDLQIL